MWRTNSLCTPANEDLGTLPSTTLSQIMPWQSSADQTEKKHTDIFSRAREGEAACERDTGIKNHAVVLEVVLRATTIHSGVEGLSGPCRGRVPQTRKIRQIVVSYPTVEAREHLPRTDDHAVAQYYMVVLEVPGRPRSGKLHQSGTKKEREQQIEKQFSAM